MFYFSGSLLDYGLGFSRSIAGFRPPVMKAEYGSKKKIERVLLRNSI